MSHIMISGSGKETFHQEWCTLTLRQRVGRYVRNTLSFSKRERWHYRLTKWFMMTHHVMGNHCQFFNTGGKVVGFRE